VPSGTLVSYAVSMITIRPYQRIIAWKEAYRLCLQVYRATSEFPSYEKFGMTSQVRRAAYSVPLNIAEGNAKRSRPERARYFTIALGSLEELHCALRLSHDLEYLSEEKLVGMDDQINRTSYLLTRLRASLMEKN